MDKSMQNKVRAMLSPWPSVTLVLALLFFFVAERLLGHGSVRVVLDVMAGLGLLAVLIWRLSLSRGLRDNARRFAWAQLGALGLLVLSLIAYALHLKAFADAADGRAPAIFYASFHLLIWTALGLIAALELSAVQMRAAAFVDWRRSRAAMLTATTLVFALGFVLAINYVAEQRPQRRDYSFGAPTSPSQATLSMVQGSDPAVHVYLFMPRGNRLLAEVLPYFEALRDAGAELTVQDQALDPELAQKLKVTGNGYVGLLRGERTGKWYLGQELDSARLRLKRMDRELRTQLAKLTVAERVVYLTTGHGERADRPSTKKDRPQAKVLADLLRSLNVTTRRLGMADGLAGAVPDDAALVIVFGPQSDFRTEEVQALRDYFKRGGSLWLMIDPGNLHGLQPLLDDIGVEPGATVCNDRVFVDASHSDADHAFIVSNNFSHHDAVRNLNMAGQRATVLFQGAAVLKPKSARWGRQTPLLRSMSGSFVDLNGNFRFDEGSEKRALNNLIIAAEGKPAKQAKADKVQPQRVVLIGDSDCLADALMANKPNLLLGYELSAWLLGEDKLGGAVDSEEDVPIQHTRDGDAWWFYGTTFAAPILILGLGLAYVSMRRRRGRRS